MLKELLQAVQDMAVRANGIECIEPPGPDVGYWLKAPDGAILWKELAPEPRNHKALALQAVVKLALLEAPHSVIWYSRSGVVCLCDDEVRRDRVTLALSFSAPLQVLQGWEKGSCPRFDQRGLVLLLRTTFADCLPLGFLDTLRGVRWHSEDKGESTVQQGKRSVGRSIESELTGVAGIPDEVTFRVPIFVSAFGYLGEVRLAVEIDPEARSFQLIPLPGQIERAIAGAEARIGEELSAALAGDGGEPEVTVYYGVP